MVTTSPSVETVGATRLSRSQSLRTAVTASSTDAPSTTIDARIPPRTLIRTRSSSEIDPSTPKASDTTLATTARTSDITTVRDMVARTFWPSTVSRRTLGVKVPVCTAVEIRLPKVLKMLPRSPIAAGIITSSPGRSSKVTTRAPRNAPADQAGERVESQRDEALARRFSGRPEQVDQPSAPVEGPQSGVAGFVGPRCRVWGGPETAPRRRRSPQPIPRAPRALGDAHRISVSGSSGSIGISSGV